MPLSFATLRAANTARLQLFKNSRGGPAHSKPDGSDWSKGEWMNAILGELGEAANLVKKVKRGDMPLEAALGELANEFADVVTYTDLTAMQFDLQFHHYVDFDAFRLINQNIFAINRGLSLGEWMNKAFGSYGATAMIVDGWDGKSSRISAGPVRNYLLNGLVAIDCAAMKIGVDLGNAVLRKFNNVSARVKADIFITQRDTIVHSFEELIA